MEKLINYNLKTSVWNLEPIVGERAKNVLINFLRKFHDKPNMNDVHTVADIAEIDIKVLRTFQGCGPDTFKRINDFRNVSGFLKE